MTRQAIAIFATAVLLSSSFPVFATGQQKITFSDPAGDVTGIEGEMDPADIVGIDISSDGEFILVSVTLTEALKPVSLFDALVAGIAFDVDSDPGTGGQAFFGAYGDVPGFEFESEILSSVDDGAASKAASASVIGIAPNGNQSSVVSLSDAPSTPSKGTTYTGKIDYSSIGAKSGQTIRIIARELEDRGDERGKFPEARLKLK